MKAERWQQIESIFQSALALKEGARADYVDKVCAEDKGLQQEVESLLGAYEQTGSFMNVPAHEVAAGLIAKDQTLAMVGQTIAHYKIISSLGAGGMGEVFLGEDTRLHRRVALKLLPAHYTRDEARVRRFEQEACAASALNHPNILTIHEIGAEGETHYIATEFIEGETLRGRMVDRTGARMTLVEVLDVAAQVASALTAAHAAGIVHRDIKPENIMVRRDGYIKVLDFGLAKLVEKDKTAQPAGFETSTRALVKTDAGTVMGTVSYMSPEQARGKEIDVRTDVWSLGVVLYEMLAGRVPFVEETMSDTTAAILRSQPAPLDAKMPPELHRIVRKALQKKADERYQTVKDMLLDLKNLKRELEFAEEIERSHIPPFAKSGNADRDAASEQPRAIQPAPRGTPTNVPHQPSSAEYIGGEVKKRKSRDVSDKLRQKLTGADERKLVKNYTQNTEAYQLYLKGRFHWNKRAPQDLQKSIEYFQQSIALDPSYALAFAGLADAYALLGNTETPPHEMRLRAREAALKALSLDDNLAEAHTALGQIVAYYDHDFAGAEREHQRAIALNPNYATARQWYSELLMALGRHEEALAEMQRALEIDPLSLILNRQYGVSLLFARQYDAAIAQLKKTIELDANFAVAHSTLSMAYRLKGNYAESVEELAKFQELTGGKQTASLMRESFAAGGWQGFLRAMTGERRPANLTPYTLATFHAALGEKDKAFVELNKSYQNREPILGLLKVDPRFDSLHDDARFQDLLRRVGFPK